MVIEANDYDNWYNTPLGQWVLEAEADLLRSSLNADKNELVVEVGCGTGRFITSCAGSSCLRVGMDRNLAMLNVARRRADATPPVWIQGDGTRIPLKSGSAEIVFVNTVLCYFDDPRPLLTEMIRVCRPGGRIVLGELNPYAPWNLWRRIKSRFVESAFRGAHWHSSRKLRRILRRLGCRVASPRRILFGPPSNWFCRREVNHFCERIGRFLFPGAGAYYVIEATFDEPQEEGALHG